MKLRIIDTYDVIKTNIFKIKEDSSVWAIYGTGTGAEMIWNIINELKCVDRLAYVFDNDDSVSRSIDFHGYTVCTVKEGWDKVDIIFVGAELNHSIVKERIINLFESENVTNIKVIDPFKYDVDIMEKEEYIHYLDNYNKYDDFLPMCEDSYVPKDTDTKIIAWYLPQFHQMEINNLYHGQGFTEWTNTTRTSPQFVGHYQPHIPYDVGYYDLMNPETMKRQIFLAKKYGIYGFGFFYYWFSGKKIMEKPLCMFLEDKKLDIPFCLHWATDDWSMAWYGESDEVVLKQEIPEVDDFWKDIYPYFTDERYIKIDGKPLFIIYKCMTFKKEEFKSFINQLRKKAKENKFPDLFVMISTGAGNFTNVDEWSGDALVEYQPWRFYQSPSIKSVLPRGYVNPNFRVLIKDLTEALVKKEYMCPYDCKKYFRSALTTWDNTARKKETNAIVMLGNTPERVQQWLIDIIAESKKIHSKEEDIVFISSWNEWAEGSHLEPDYRYGYAWLNAVKRAIEVSRNV